MIFIITDKRPLMSKLGTYQGVKVATKIGEETILSDKEPEIQAFQNRQLLYAFDIPTEQYNERLDYVIAGMRKQARLPEEFPVIREWIDRGQGAEQISFEWWEVKFK